MDDFDEFAELMSCDELVEYCEALFEASELEEQIKREKLGKENKNESH